MFISLKRNVTSALQTVLTLTLGILCIYLLRTILLLYEDYQKLNRLEGYMNMIERIQERADTFQLKNEALNEDFKAVKDAIGASLHLNLTHKN
jgi:hypothetical protein